MTAKGYQEVFNRDTAEWRTADHGDGDGSRVEVALLPDGGWAVRDSREPGGPVLFFTPAEVRAFVAGVKDGEFDT
ncbi:hypothetical protein GCM10010172_45580 [Paractinoplanes ferrugineus]|uniref:DUF397 domain-containing protein n=1 Tax=Paractinoplanes ferrugineus TaxID=113564 RepID=A0A919J8M4_9ACTN|nr:DUF397 domain-containing protein [Actinoplanes ferrugineus]GIE15569.1 hypothetical protein Afe05nite_74090 [Actinoplanes ferrugineus]